jgi:putative membrane protein
MAEKNQISRQAVILWLLIFAAVFVWSVIRPRDYVIWLLEVMPAVIAFVLLALTWKRFPLTALSYWLILIHAVILMVGGHYTYAEVPLFNWLRDVFDLSRNSYDKVGHFAQGFIPAIIAREVLIRTSPVKGGGWLFFLVVSVCLAISAFYELIEWWVALLSEEAAEAFLGTQGYVWDAQSDMFFALVGAVLALVLLKKVHDRQLARLGEKS